MTTNPTGRRRDRSGAALADLCTWLRAQLDADEHGVHEWLNRQPDSLLTSSLRDVHELIERESGHLLTDRTGARRMTADIAATRALIDDITQRLQHADPAYADETVDAETDGLASTVLRLLAVRYAHRDGYRPQWFPA